LKTGAGGIGLDALLDQFVLKGVEGKFGVRFQAHFFEDASAVRAYGAHAEIQEFGNHADRLARRDQA
jgi:hypothetical protein